LGRRLEKKSSPIQLDLFAAEAEASANPTPRIAPLQRSTPPQLPPNAAIRNADPCLLAAEDLRATLEAAVRLRIQLRITNNRATVMSVRYENAGQLAQLRLHHMFLSAPDEIVDALAHWVRHPRSRKFAALLNGFIRANNHLIRSAPASTAPCRTLGQVHDLAKLYAEVNREEFDHRVDAPITWGKMPPKARRRSIRFGSYAPQEHLIRIHPLLDDTFVPEWFVRYIVFHEMLHADLGIEEVEGRRVIHSRAFRLREREYADFARAVAWLETPAHLARLLGRSRARRNG